MNRRFFLGLDRGSARGRRERARQRRREARGAAAEPTASRRATDGSEQQGAEGGDERAQQAEARGRRRSSVVTFALTRLATYNPSHPIPARLVSERSENETVYEAKQVGSCERNWKLLVACILVLGGLAVAVSLALGMEVSQNHAATDEPTVQPTSSPTHDRRPTLQVVEERGVVRCGFRRCGANGKYGCAVDYVDVCRFVASVLFGNSSKFDSVSVTLGNRFQVLQSRKADLLLSGDTHLVEREIKEPTTGVGFAFSTPFVYSGIKYLGDEDMVRCAEEEQRFDNCRQLKICVLANTTLSEIIARLFPSDFYTTMAPYELSERYLDGTCNTILHEFPRAWLLHSINASDEAAASKIASTYIGTKNVAYE